MNDAHVDVREMSREDEPAVADFVRDLTAYEARLSDDRDPSDKACRDHFAYLMDEVRNSGGFCLVARRNNRLLGCLIGAPERMPGFLVRPEHRVYGEIHVLYVVPEARKLGVARRLLGAAGDRFREAGCRQVGLYTLAGNEQAIEAYERLGFDHYEVFMRKRL